MRRTFTRFLIAASCATTLAAASAPSALAINDHDYCGYAVSAHSACSWVVRGVTARYNLARVGNTTPVCERVTHAVSSEPNISRRCATGSVTAHDDLLPYYNNNWTMNAYVGNDDDFTQTIFGTVTY